MLDDVPPLTGLQAESELASQIQEEIKKKLLAEYSYAGTVETMSHVLPEYIKVMVCNAKPRKQVVEDLNLFLKDAAPKFVDWLWGMLADRNPARTHSAFDAPNGAQGADDSAMADNDMNGRQQEENRRRGRDDTHYPSARGFRNALQSAAKESRQDKSDKEKESRGRFRPRDTERENREMDRREREHNRPAGVRKEFDKDGELHRGGADRDRRRERGSGERDRGEQRDRHGVRDRERERDRENRRRREEEERKPRKQFNRMGEEAPPAETPAAAAGPIRFRITDSKGAGDYADSIASKLESNTALASERDRSLLSAPRTGTKFTITLDKLDPAEIPSISHYADEQPAVEEQVPAYDAYNPWGGKGGAGKGVKGAKGDAGRGANVKWNVGGNMTWTPGGGTVTQQSTPVAKGRPPAAHHPQFDHSKVAVKGGGGRGASNMVWQNPSAPAATEKPHTAMPTLVAPKTEATSPTPWRATARGVNNKTWVNPNAPKKPEASTPMQEG